MSRRSHIKRAKVLRKLWYRPAVVSGSGAGYMTGRECLCRRRRRIANAIRSAYR